MITLASSPRCASVYAAAICAGDGIKVIPSHGDANFANTLLAALDAIL